MNKIIDFEKAKTKLNRKHPPKIDIEELLLEDEDYRLAKFYSQWYNDHVVGRGEKGNWIYKNL